MDNFLEEWEVTIGSALDILPSHMKDLSSDGKKKFLKKALKKVPSDDRDKFIQEYVSMIEASAPRGK